jgi:hypothetical protein
VRDEIAAVVAGLSKGDRRVLLDRDTAKKAACLRLEAKGLIFRGTWNGDAVWRLSATGLAVRAHLEGGG